jgi:hypothetical protein
LTAVSAVGLVRSIPVAKTFGNYAPRSAVALGLFFAWLAGVAYLGPQRLVRYGGTYMESARLSIPSVGAPSLVFVHGGWPTRIAMRLVAHGLRGDSLEAVMAQNPTCDVHNFAVWYASKPVGRAAAPTPLRFSPDLLNTTSQMEIAQGDEIRYRRGIPLSRTCLREVASDTLGIIDIAPLLWQGDMPGLRGTGAMIVRDMGPEANARLIARYPERVPMLYYRPEKEGVPKLAPYAVGIKTLWPDA